MGSATGSTQIDSILKLATSQLGTTEYPMGSNTVIYNTEYYMRQVSGGAYPWCVVFIWWLFKTTKNSHLFYGGHKTASSTTLLSDYAKRGQTVSVDNARLGDIVFFNFDGNSANVEHVGLFLELKNGMITTLDGNTGTSSEANGGAVMKRTRPIQYVGGVARPMYHYDEEVSHMTTAEVQKLVQSEVSRLFAEQKRVIEHQQSQVSDWAVSAWERAVTLGVFDGTNPGAPLTREQAAVVLERLSAQGNIVRLDGDKNE